MLLLKRFMQRIDVNLITEYNTEMMLIRRYLFCKISIFNYISYTRYLPVLARVHLAANELKEFPQRHLSFIHNIV